MTDDTTLLAALDHDIAYQQQRLSRLPEMQRQIDLARTELEHAQALGNQPLIEARQTMLDLQLHQFEQEQTQATEQLAKSHAMRAAHIHKPTV